LLQVLKLAAEFANLLLQFPAETGSCTCCSAASLDFHTPHLPPQTRYGFDRRSCSGVEVLHPPKICPTDFQWKLHKQEMLQCWRTVGRGTALLGRGLSTSPPSCAAAADLAWTCRKSVAGCCSTPEQVGEELASENAAPVAAET